jgi:hypothetical protein
MRYAIVSLSWTLAGVAAAIVLTSALVRVPARAEARGPSHRMTVTPAATGPAHPVQCSGGGGSPSAPLKIEFVPLPRQKGDDTDQRRLRVQVTSWVSAPALEVKLAFPPGVTLLRGETQWQAPARAAATQVRDLLLYVPPTGERRIVATARLVFQRSLPMGTAAGYTYHEKPLAPPPAGPLQEPDTLPRLAAPLEPAPK